MPNYEFQISDYERIFRKRYKIVLLTAICATVFSIFFSRMKPPIFTAAATVKVDRNSVMGFESVAYGSWDNIETQTEVITSFPVLFLAAKNLRILADTLSEDLYSSDEQVLSQLEGLRGQVSANLASGTNMINIRSTSLKPEQARNTANAMAFAYKEFSLRSKKLYAFKTREFIQEQLKRNREDLQAAELDLRAFEEEQDIPSVSASVSKTIADAEKIKNQIEAINQSLAVIELQKKKLSERYSQRFIAPASSRVGGVDNPAKGDSLGAMARMSWISDFTDQDPGIKSLNDRLIQLQIQLNDQLSYFKTTHPANKDIETRIKGTIEEILQEFNKKLNDLTSKRAVLLNDKNAIDAQVAMIPSNEMDYARLQRKLKISEETNTLLETKRQESLIAEAGVVDDVSIMSMATLPRSPDNKGVARMALMGVLLGLLLGVIFAVIREMFDTSIGTIEEVENTLKITVLAVIPHIQFDEPRTKKEGKKKKNSAGDAVVRPVRQRAGLVTQFLPKEPCSEAYRILRTNVEYLSFESPIKTILITSATMQEGKSTTIANFAITLAQQGKRVLLLECNMRRPSLYRTLGIDKGPGTADILIEKAKWQDCVNTVTDLVLGEFTMDEVLSIPGLENLHIIPFGHTPPNPAELLSSSKMDNLLRELRENFDVVLVDGPPLLPVADSMVISTKVDGVILVYKAGSVPRSSVKLAKERLDAVQARMLGVVLNDIRPETSGGHYSVYSRYYGKKDERHENNTVAVVNKR